MDVSVSVKREEDEPGFDPSSPSVTANALSSNADTYPSTTAAATKTSAIDSNLSASDFFERISLVKIGGEDGNKLWPALKFDSIRELQDAVKNDVNVPAADLARLQQKIYQRGHSGKSGIAYLLGRGKMKRSLVPLTNEGMVDNFYSLIDEIKGKDDYQGDVEFQKACAIVMMRSEELDSDDDSMDATVALSSPPSPLARQQAASSNQAQAKVEKEVSDLGDSPAEPNGSQIATEKRKRNGGEDGKESEKKKKTITKHGKTPKTKAKKTSIVTPGPSKLDDGKHMSEMISPTDEPYSVMTNAEAWKLLEAKFGVAYVSEKYYLISQEKPVATSLANLRKDLCANGLPECSSPLSEQEQFNIARWVRYTHVAGLVDGQHIDPDDLGEPISKFMAGWKVLRDNFGCRYSSGKYTVPTSLSGREKKEFERTIEVDRHFARFGIQCIPDDATELSKKDRLSLDIYFASPAFGVVNTFERIGTEDNGDGTTYITPRRKRSAVQYY